MSCSMIDIVGSLDFWRSCRMISCLYTFVRGSIAYYPFAHKCDDSTIIEPRSLKVHWHCLALPILLYKVFGPIGLQPERRQFFSHLFATSVLGRRGSSQVTTCTFWRRGVWPLTGSAIPSVEEDQLGRCLVLGKVKGSGNCVANFPFLCSASTRQVNNRETNSTLFLLQGELWELFFFTERGAGSKQMQIFYQKDFLV